MATIKATAITTKDMDSKRITPTSPKDALRLRQYSRGLARPALGRLAVCFAVGAVIGTALDGIHVYGDVLEYPHRAFGRWAAFVPLEFGLVATATALLAPTLERLSGGPPDWSPLQRLAELALIAALYWLTTIVDGAASVALAVALLALAAIRAASGHGDWPYVALAAVLGPAGEALISAAGAFSYLDPDIAGIPLWLPGLWANGGFAIRRLLVPIAIAPAERSLKPAR